VPALDAPPTLAPLLELPALLLGLPARPAEPPFAEPPGIVAAPPVLAPPASELAGAFESLPQPESARSSASSKPKDTLLIFLMDLRRAGSNEPALRNDHFATWL